MNSKGLFNVPSGIYKNPKICDEVNLLAVSHALQNVQITTGDYLSTKNFIDATTFVYIDPPYRPLNQSSSFTAYTKDGFGDQEQIALKKFIDKMYGKGANKEV